MFQIKICGITRIDDGLAAVAAGADAVGVNFYAASPRCVSTKTAQAILAALPVAVTKVGVFVNASAREIREQVRNVGLTAVQLHGDEEPELLRELADLAVIRAWRLPSPELGPVLDYLHRCEKLSASPRALLIDAFQSGSYGGTGQVAHWPAVVQLKAHLKTLPLVLAGGLCPENVAAAIRAVRPAAVDTASGVESGPGQKSAELLQAFISAAKQEFQAISLPTQ